MYSQGKSCSVFNVTNSENKWSLIVAAVKLDSIVMAFKKVLFPVITARFSVFNKRSSRSDHVFSSIEFSSTIFPITIRFSKLTSDNSVSVSFNKLSTLTFRPVTFPSI